MSAVVPQLGEAPTPLGVRAHALPHRAKPRRVFRVLPGWKYYTQQDIAENNDASACCPDCERADRNGETLCQGCRYNRKRVRRLLCDECHADAMRMVAAERAAAELDERSFGEWLYR